MTASAVQPAGERISAKRIRILVRGAVQGVGFRPYVYRQAAEHGLTGWVGNSTEGVTIEAQGAEGALDAFVETIRSAPPGNAAVSAMEIREVDCRGGHEFVIRESEARGARTTHVPSDLATCDACLGELADPGNRRYRYPFINCTRCGPRYSIIEAMPYDRRRTSMRRFPMCNACREEYGNPRDRRFHAEPNACPQCGPRLSLWSPNGVVLASEDEALECAGEALRAGRIVALKGIGGFHLLVDARNETAVRRLREVKRREEKPFAVMFPTLADVRASSDLDPVEEALLGGPQRPIVLVRRSGGAIAASVAPGNPRLGALLPYSALHHLLMRSLGFPVVATSGNVSDEPIVSDESQALSRLGGIADVFVVHDRAIVRPVDDSVVHVVCGTPQLLRRARGYAPMPAVAGHAGDALAEGVLACGGHSKSTVAITAGGNIFMSQHLGDLDTAPARDAYQRALDDLVLLHAVQPRTVVRDLHPDYASSRIAERFERPLLALQHHVAHVAACMAEHDLAPPVLGVAWDGSGYGPDGSLWGGEFLLVTARGWQRVAHLRTFRLPGGEAAVREPRRAALGMLFEIYAEDALAMTDLAPVAAFAPSERKVLGAMLARGVNAPPTSSAGRVFDAFAAICDLRQRAGYEGQAAAALEWTADGCATGRRYDMTVDAAACGPLTVDWAPALAAALADRRTGVATGSISEALHNGLAAAIAAVATRVGEPRVVLSGGCFQNRRLTEAAVAALERVGSTPFWHRRVPPNDGGIAVGQAAWAARYRHRENPSCA